MRIYEIKHSDGEKEWLGINGTNIEALRMYCECTECDLFDMDGSEIREVPRDEWNKLFIRDEENTLYDSDEDEDCEELQSFAEWAKENPGGGMIAGTMY